MGATDTEVVVDLVPEFASETSAFIEHASHKHPNMHQLHVRQRRLTP